MHVRSRFALASKSKGCNCCENKIIIIGGRVDGIKSAKVTTFNTKTCEFGEMPKMLNERESHSAVINHDRLYVIGDHKSIESIDLNEDEAKWEILKGISLPQL